MPPAELPDISPALRLADWAQTIQRSILRQMVDVVSQPGVLSFAGGLPAPELFPTEPYAEAVSEVLAEDPRALQYSPTHRRLQEHIASLMALRGVACRPEEIIVTTGAQQALNIVARLLLNPGDQVLFERQIYTGIQQAVASHRPEVLTVPTDLRTGLDVDAVARLLEGGARPAFLYVIPEGHNPLGMCLSEGKRQQLADLAGAYGLPILEDDPYGFLVYDRPGTGKRHHLAPVRAHAPDWVFYAGSFSKIMAPGLRLGWLLTPASAQAKVGIVREGVDLEASGLTQRAVARYLDGGHLPAHLDRLRATYQERRDIMLEALARHFPAGARWSEPHAGMFIWVELPAGIDTLERLPVAVAREKVAYVPGQAFAAPGHDASNCLRLSFSNCAPDRIEDGIRRLARVIGRSE